MIHWHASCILGLCVTGRYRPLCSVIHCAPECRARAAFQRWADRYFDEPDHTLRMHAIWLLGSMLRERRTHRFMRISSNWKGGSDEHQ